MTTIARHHSGAALCVILLLAWMLTLWLIEQGIPLSLARRRPVGTNLSLTVAVIAVNLLCAALMVVLAKWTDVHHFGVFNWLGVGGAAKLIGGVVLLDLWAAYAIHVLLHKVGTLWRIHSVHHSDTPVDVTTAFWQHPAESLLRIAFLMSGMIALGLPLWIVAVYQTLSSLNAQLEHANIRIHPRVDRLLQWVVVTPNYHKVHHSQLQLETDSNYGNIFSLWDRRFSTANRRHAYDDIAYGLDYLERGTQHTFPDLMMLRFRNLAEH